MGYSRKKTKQREGGRGFVDMGFPGILKKEHVEIPTGDKLEVEFSKLTPVLPVLTIPELTQSLNFKPLSVMRISV